VATVTGIEPLQTGSWQAMQPWGSALANRRFRTVLLIIAGVPIAVAYAWYGLFWPIFWGQVSDFRQWYLEGARIVAAGGDPYRCTANYCTGQTEQWLGAAGAIYPPFALWIVQPLTRFDPTVVDAVALIGANACLALFIVLTIRALSMTDWQERALVTLACVSFAPTLTEVQNRNFQLLILLASAVFLLGWLRGDRWWGGLALGAGLAIKLVQTPLLLLGVWARRWWLVASAACAWAVLWLVAAPRLLPEYLFQVLPSVGQGSGAEMNVAPLGAVARVLHPGSLYEQGRGVDAPVLVISVAAGIAVLVITAARLRVPRADRDGRAAEVAVAVAATPILLTAVWAGQLVLLLLPMIVLFHRAIDTGSRGLAGAVAVAWLLIGPVYLAFTNAFANGIGFPLLFQVWSESAVAGAVVLWIASLYALKPSR
jgi:hypothetical protein